MLPPWALAVAALLLAAGAGFVLRAAGPTAGAVAAWPALHLLLALTGGLASPLAPLAAAWTAAAGASFGRRRVRRAALLGAAAFVLLAAGHLLREGAVPPLDALRAALVVALGAVAGALLPGRRPDALPVEEAEDERAEQVDAEARGDDVVLADLLETVRRATDAHEAALWRREAGSADAVGDGVAVRIARAALPDHAAGEERAALEGHPLGWALREGLPVHAQRGRRPLPTPWAAEMLLVPVALPDGVLALAYPGVAPPSAEASAVVAGRLVEGVASLLGVRRAAERGEARVRALSAAVRSLPGEVRLERLAGALAEAVLGASGAAGAAVVGVGGEGEPPAVLHVAMEEEAEPPRLPDSGVAADSRVALALKHGVALRTADLARERGASLFGSGEGWASRPRSVAVQPLAVDGRTLGAAVAWHPEPGRFGDGEVEALELLARLAGPSLRSARHVEALDRRATTDRLTSLPNRAAWESRMASTAAHFDRYARPFAAVILDVDHFKKFNDTWGHEAGDEVLRHVARTLRATVREVDLPARLGGEEFVVLLPETELDQAVEAAERIRRAVEAGRVVWEGRPLSVTASFGVAACPECGPSPAELLGLADAALYRSKERGRNRVTAAPRAGAAGPSASA